jgi:hypothetical protein
MRDPVVIENIADLRRREGIEDRELFDAIRALGVGDFVRLTLMADAAAGTGETVRVRINGIDAGRFRGRVAEAPKSAALAGVRIGCVLKFTREHIHSLPAPRPRGRAAQIQGSGAAYSGPLPSPDSRLL